MSEPIIVRDTPPDRLVLDANGDEVPLPPDFPVTAGFRTFMEGRVPAPNCPHYMRKIDLSFGFRNCEHCERGAGA
jgi:hypothetical protein